MSYRHQKRRKPRNGHRGGYRGGNRGGRSNNSTRVWKLLGGIAFCALTLGGAGYVALQDASKAKADEFGCYLQPSGQAHTVVLVDSSAPGFDEVQSRDMNNAMETEFKQRLEFNERLEVITTQEKAIGTFLDPVISLCAPAKTSAELKSVGAATATPAFLKKQADKLYSETFKPGIVSIFATNPPVPDRQLRESPILEQIRSISKMDGFTNATGQRRLIIISDLIQSTQEIQFCHTAGHLPSYAKFKAKSGFAQIAPRSLNGVEVEVYMLLGRSLGSGSLSHCTESELTNWWREYLQDTGAQSVDITRIRPGG